LRALAISACPGQSPTVFALIKNAEDGAIQMLGGDTLLATNISDHGCSAKRLRGRALISAT